ncbi:MAG: fasciclin domain-containing protein [Pseudomonadota bacterium]
MRKTVFAAAAALAFVISSPASAANIVQTAASAGQFNTLLAAAKAAGLAGALSGNTKLTVFAPTDAAFAKLPKGTVENLLKPENRDQLADLLKYHVVAGEVNAADIPLGVTQVPTIKEGGDTKVITTRWGNNVTVDFARVITADIQTSNGVIHVIDKVLIPTN